jgi:hypothetical protein
MAASQYRTSCEQLQRRASGEEEVSGGRVFGFRVRIGAGTAAVIVSIALLSRLCGPDGRLRLVEPGA